MFSTTSFMKNPILWVQLMSTLKANFSFAPDFGLSYLLEILWRKRCNLVGGTGDLSSVILLQNDAEPIREQTKGLFETTFSQYNLYDRWFCAGHGVAEMVVCISSMCEYNHANYKRMTPPGTGVLLWRIETLSQTDSQTVIMGKLEYILPL